MRTLITGAEGLVGSAVTAHLLAGGHEVSTLTLPDAAPHDGVRVVRGDATDADAVRVAAAGVDAVVHLAAIPTPWGDVPPVVFGNNTLATFTVLWTAAELGVRRFAIASSVNATGLIMNEHRPLPPRFPIDETIAPDLADPYSLSKYVDEHTLRTVCRRFGASGVAFRLPLMISPGNLARLRASQQGRPQDGVGDGWGWLEVRDAAEARAGRHQPRPRPARVRPAVHRHRRPCRARRSPSLRRPGGRPAGERAGPVATDRGGRPRRRHRPPGAGAPGSWSDCHTIRG
jgi:nucleoside-diphosphate-sugar epimerase